ncbi:DNA gyrase subunit A [Candidatus Gottesmanbacteria bacterium]|nr:DNA gyrase subunit A [Candidatus Gottesmanbacteria bacterium]
MNIGKLLPVEITEEMQKSYLDYAMSVIVARALPDVKDGLKPVHRRILYAMHEMGLHHTSKFSKSAKIVGEVLGKYHPHGDIPVYDALIAAEMLFDLEKETVDFTPNFDNTLKEPVYLPAKLPNLLLIGSEGIAVGMATKIPPHNLAELIDAIVFIIDKVEHELKVDNKNLSSVTTEELMEYVHGPDFPTAGIIFDKAEIANAYSTGKGKVVMRGRAEIEDIAGGNKSAIIITELPYQVNKAQMVERIADLVKDKKLEGISDLRDESDRHGIRVVIELKRDARPKQVLNNLYKHTSLQSVFPVNMVALVDGTPQTLTLKTILEEYIRHRQRVVTKRSEFELKQAKARAHILEGLKIAVDHIDEVIQTIKKSQDADEAKKNLMTKFGLTEIQAIAILDMQLRRLAALERQKIEDELAMVMETIAYLEDLLSHGEKVLKVIKEEILQLKEKYGDDRKTKVIKSKVGEFSDEDLIPNEKMIITLTKTGYVKRLSPSSYRAQARGGKGVTGMITKEEDEIDHLVSANTHDNILFFTNKGKVYQLRVWDLPESSRVSKGQAVVNLINIAQDEKVNSLLTYSSEADKTHSECIFLTTRQGTVKKTTLSQYENIRKNGLTAIKLETGDELVWAKITSGDEDIMLFTHQGKSIRFSEKEVRSTGRDTIGVRGVRMKKDDLVVGMESVPQKIEHPSDKRLKFFRDILVVSERGIGKRTPVTSFPKQRRGGQGVKVANVTAKTGPIVTAQMVSETIGQLVLATKSGKQTIKVPIDSVPRLGRATQGVILMRLSDKSDFVAAVACLEKE